MASAVLSPGAPSSFLVRALTSGRGEGGGKLLARTEGYPVHALWEGAGKGRFQGQRSLLGLEEGRQRAGNRAGRGKKGLGRAPWLFLFLQSRGSGTAVAREEGWTPRSVLGPEEFPRFHSPHSVSLPPLTPLPARPAGRAARR